MTRHYYDRAGRLVRSVTRRDPEWTEQDRAWVLALTYWRDTRCPLCGGDIQDCTAPDEDLVVNVPPPRRCKATDALLDKQKQYESSPKPRALLWRTEVERRR